jgi:hypothetical protein
MAEKEATKTGLRKVFVYGVIAFLLLVLPAVSYLYLYKGFKWRVDAQSELQDYGKIRAAYSIWPDGTKENLRKGKVCVLHLFGANPELTPANKLIMDTGEELYKQFGFKGEAASDHFRIVMISEGGSTEFRSYAQTRPSSDMVNWVWTGGLGSWTTILKNGYDYYCVKSKVTPYPEYYALSDTSGVIRRFYNAEDPEDVKRMVQQTALLLPK